MTTDTRRMARSTDPRESKRAAAAIAPTLHTTHARLLDIIRANPGLNRVQHGEIYNRVYGPFIRGANHVQQRFNELARAGHVVRVDNGERYGAYVALPTPQPPKARVVEHAWCSHCRHEVDFPPEGQLGMRL